MFIARCSIKRRNAILRLIYSDGYLRTFFHVCEKNRERFDEFLKKKIFLCKYTTQVYLRSRINHFLERLLIVVNITRLSQFTMRRLNLREKKRLAKIIVRSAVSNILVTFTNDKFEIFFC